MAGPAMDEPGIELSIPVCRFDGWYAKLWWKQCVCPCHADP